MSRYTLAAAADADIRHILVRSVMNWGMNRAERYIFELHAALENLALFPDVGSDIGHLRAGYFRFPHASHSIFYRKTDDGILIVRVLHQRQLPGKHL